VVGVLSPFTGWFIPVHGIGLSRLPCVGGCGVGVGGGWVEHHEPEVPVVRWFAVGGGFGALLGPEKTSWLWGVFSGRLLSRASNAHRLVSLRSVLG
jgi:hypothetical protein